MGTMRAVVYRGPGEVGLAEVPRPALREPGDALVRVMLGGICGTDLHVIRGDLAGVAPGMVLGHEFVGEVVELGAEVRRLRVGDRVTASDFTACGDCRWCLRQAHWHCPQRAFFGTGTAFGPMLAGAQAEYVRVPLADTTLAVLPANCPPEAALLIGDNLATGWIALDRGGLQPGDCVAIVGGGAVGQLAALSALACGAGAVVVVEPQERRRVQANAQGALAVAPEGAVDLVRSVTEGDGADIVVEAVGAGAALELALSLVRRAGRVVSVGAHAAAAWKFPLARAFSDELHVGFAIGDAIRLRPQLLRMVATGALDPTVVIDHRGRLEEVPALYRDLIAQKKTKVVFTL